MPSRHARTRIVRGSLAGLGALAISVPGLACGDDDDDGGSPGAYGGGAAADTTSTVEETTAAAGEPVAVEAFDFGFDPNAATIEAGDTVSWENTGETVHNVKGKGFFSDGMEPGDTFEHEFAKAGVYDYLCTLHPDSMTGTVVVE
jgi:plastocyanin